MSRAGVGCRGNGVGRAVRPRTPRRLASARRPVTGLHLHPTPSVKSRTVTQFVTPVKPRAVFSLKTGKLETADRKPRNAGTWPQKMQSLSAEFQHPAPHRFIGDVEPTLGEQFLHVSVAQREADIKPHRVLNDPGRKAMTAIRKLSHGS